MLMFENIVICLKKQVCSQSCYSAPAGTRGHIFLCFFSFRAFDFLPFPFSALSVLYIASKDVQANSKPYRGLILHSRFYLTSKTAR